MRKRFLGLSVGLILLSGIAWAQCFDDLGPEEKPWDAGAYIAGARMHVQAADQLTQEMVAHVEAAIRQKGMEGLRDHLKTMQDTAKKSLEDLEVVLKDLKSGLEMKDVANIQGPTREALSHIQEALTHTQQAVRSAQKGLETRDMPGALAQAREAMTHLREAKTHVEKGMERLKEIP